MSKKHRQSIERIEILESELKASGNVFRGWKTVRAHYAGYFSYLDVLEPRYSELEF